jgi:hypothetical protein
MSNHALLDRCFNRLITEAVQAGSSTRNKKPETRNGYPASADCLTDVAIA